MKPKFRIWLYIVSMAMVVAITSDGEEARMRHYELRATIFPKPGQEAPILQKAMLTSKESVRAAFDLLGEESDAGIRADHATVLAHWILERDFRKLGEVMDCFSKDNRRLLVASFVGSAVEKDHQSALVVIRRTLVGEELERALGSAVRTLAGQGKFATARSVLSELPPSYARKGAIEDLAIQFGSKDRTGCVAWLVTLPPEDRPTAAGRILSAVASKPDKATLEAILPHLRYEPQSRRARLMLKALEQP
jgi:hypothetical protein